MPRVTLLALSLLATLFLLPAAAHAGPSGVVVSQVYGGGGNAGASFRNDYVELFNTGAAAVDLSGWTVQYATAGGTTWQPTALSGSIPSGGYYLVQLGSSSDNGGPLPLADAVGTSNLSATSGKIALVRDAAALTCGASAGSCAADPLVEDFVGYGDASDFEGAGSAPGLSSTESALRGTGGCVDSDDNAADFAAGTPEPRNSASSLRSCDGAPPPRPGPSGASGSASVDLDIAATLSVSLDRPALSFGTAALGDTPAPLPETVTVASNNLAGYSLAVNRTAFAPADLPLAISATAPAGAELGGAVAGGGLVPIPIAPASPLILGTTAAPSAPAGDVWPTSIGFSAPLPIVAAGRYAATVTFTVVAR